MKTLSNVFLSLMLLTSFVAFSNPTSSLNSVEKAQQAMYQDFEKNLIKWSTMEGFVENGTVEFIVYCEVNENNQVELKRVIGGDKGLKTNMYETMEKHPLEVSELLKGESFKFKLRFERH